MSTARAVLMRLTSQVLGVTVRQPRQGSFLVERSSYTKPEKKAHPPRGGPQSQGSPRRSPSCQGALFMHARLPHSLHLRVAALTVVLGLVFIAVPLPVAGAAGPVDHGTQLLAARAIVRGEVSQGPVNAPAPEVGSGPAIGGEVRVDARFDNAPVGNLTAAMLRAQFETHGAHVPYAEGKNLNALSVVTNPEGSGRVLQARIPAGAVGGIMNFPVNIIQEGPGYNEAYLSYRLRFGDGFDFTPYGGKIPGLAGGPSKGNLSKEFPAGCTEATGQNGFSARGMWDSWMNETGKKPVLDQYVYHMHKTKRCGDNFLYNEGPSGLTTLQANRWYDITSRVVMNDPGQRNGMVEAWLDGEKVLSKSGLEFRTTNAWGINVLYMAGFFGGNDSAWAHDRVEKMYYDDFVVHAVR